MALAGHHHPGQQVELGTSFQEAHQDPGAQRLGKRAPPQVTQWGRVQNFWYHLLSFSN